MPTSRYHRYHGFTLIELLIVIVIIGLLTGLATTSYINAQKTARDNTRKADVASIATAVESFYQAKRRFPGLLGGQDSLPSVGTRATWQGCLVLDTAGGYSGVAYYSYPTVPNGAGDKQPCNARGTVAGFNGADYGAYPNWIPELGEYLNPVPQEKRYQAYDGQNNRTLDDADGTFSANTRDVLGNNLSQAYVYRRLSGGYMVYSRLESMTTDILGGGSSPVTFSDRPKYLTSNGSSEVGVTVYKNNVFLIRK
jgi:prepilin-type N-terminal cleavage/methylation domain-containing protein